MQYSTQPEYRYSSAFWFKKLLQLIGLILLGIAIWWLWQWEDDSGGSDSTSTNTVEAVDTDGDGINDDDDSDDDNDGFSDTDEATAGSDPLDASSVPGTDTDGDGFNDDVEAVAGSDSDDAAITPDNYDADGDGFAWSVEDDAGSDPDDAASTPDNSDAQSSNGDASAVPFSLAIPGFSGEPEVSSNGTSDCVYTYEYEEVSTLTVYDSCLPSQLGQHDWQWVHSTDNQLTSSPVAYDCWGGQDPAATLCSHGNGVLEVVSGPDFLWDSEAITNENYPDEFVIFEFNDNKDTNETNAVSEFSPIIESFSRN